MAYLLFNKAKEEGMSIELNWQDQDSSSGLSFRSVFPDGDLNRIMLCGGHVGRSHGNNMKEYKAKKMVDKGFLDKHKKDYPSLQSVECVCAGKKHSKNCGCINDNFIVSAKRNHFSALKQSGNDPSEYARRMRILGKYHCRDIHSWVTDKGVEEQCGFHPQKVCSCGKCSSKSKDCEQDHDNDSTRNDKDKPNSKSAENLSKGVNNSELSDSINSDKDDISESDDHSSTDKDDNSDRDDSNESEQDDKRDRDDSNDSDNDENSSSDHSGESDSDDSSDSDPEDIQCDGKPYKTRAVLKCPLHALLYKIECNRVARKATDVVHSEMGRGHSNLPESKFNVLTRFRSKNVNLHQLHYEFITNVGLCQSNMTYMYKTIGPQYHWMRPLLAQMGLPIPDGIEDVWEGENRQRMTALEKKRTEKAKRDRVRRK